MENKFNHENPKKSEKQLKKACYQSYKISKFIEDDIKIQKQQDETIERLREQFFEEFKDNEKIEFLQEYQELEKQYSRKQFLECAIALEKTFFKQYPKKLPKPSPPKVIEPDKVSKKPSK